VKVTYLLHLWIVLVSMMVQSRPYHLRHQWSQISTFVSLNHIHHHTYFKSSYVHIQVFHILHHHTMKLLLAFKSFLPRRPIVEINSENWFAAGCAMRQRESVRCRLRNAAARIGSLRRHNISSENWFAAANMFCSSKCYFATNNSISAASHKFTAHNTTSTMNHNFAVEHTIRQRILIRCRKLNFDSESQICCRQLNLGSESQLHCRTHDSAANANSLQTTQFWQRITNSL